MHTKPIGAHEALARLKRGNLRFASGFLANSARMLQARRADLVTGQAPFAAILGCSDSRVPVELVFDQGLGDLFVVRVAGNIAAPSQIGSLEFAAEKFGTRLVVVLGHTGCGAVQETLEQLHQPAGTGSMSENLAAIVSGIRPAVVSLLKDGRRPEPGDLMQQAVRANVSAAVDRLKTASPGLDRLARGDGLLIVGAVYVLETGRVDFFDSP